MPDVSLPPVGAPVGKLCYAPPARIPHPPHVWYELERAPTGGLRHAPRHCDGWAALWAAFTRGMAASPTPSTPRTTT